MRIVTPGSAGPTVPARRSPSYGLPALENHVPEAFTERLEDVRRQRRRARHEEPRPLTDATRRIRRQVEQPHVHRGDAEEQRRLVLEKPRLGPRRLEACRQVHVASGGEPRVDAVAEAVHVKERERAQEAIVRRDAPRLDDGAGIGGEVAVREHCPLGRAGGA
jgi:hypothetical protein